MIKEYRVSWDIEVSADSYQDAVNQALEIQRDPSSEAIHFTVQKMPLIDNQDKRHLEAFISAGTINAPD